MQDADLIDTSYYHMLHQICQAEQIDLQFLSTNWVKRLAKGDQVHFISGYKFDLNPAAASLNADDKYATYSILQAADVPVVEHAILYSFDNTSNYVLGRNSIAYVKHYFDTHNQHIVIKPNRGTGGRQVYQLSDFAMLPSILSELFQKHPTASLCPFYQIKHEYRVVLLDGVERLAYMKTANPDNWKFNLQQGATSSPIPEHLHTQVSDLAKRAAQALGLRFCSADIIETADKLLVLEVNSGVMIRKYIKQHPDEFEKIKAIYRDAIRKMFE